jgi:hypothetical protein
VHVFQVLWARSKQGQGDSKVTIGMAVGGVLAMLGGIFMLATVLLPQLRASFSLAAPHSSPKVGSPPPQVKLSGSAWGLFLAQVVLRAQALVMRAATTTWIASAQDSKQADGHGAQGVGGEAKERKDGYEEEEEERGRQARSAEMDRLLVRCLDRKAHLDLELAKATDAQKVCSRTLDECLRRSGGGDGLLAVARGRREVEDGRLAYKQEDLDLPAPVLALLAYNQEQQSREEEEEEVDGGKGTGGASEAMWAEGLARMFEEPLDPYDDDVESAERRAAIRQAFGHAWEGYARHAFGRDELKPLSEEGGDVMGVGLTMVDSLDTMLVMGMHKTDHYRAARDWVVASLAVRPERDVSVFECTIRVLGGLLSAFALSGDRGLAGKARQLGDGLAAAFATPTGLPASVISLAHPQKRTGLLNPYNGKTMTFADPTTVAEAGSLQLEMQYLAHMTRNSALMHLADWSTAKLLALGLHPQEQPGSKGGGGGRQPAGPLFPVDLHPREGRFVSERISTGAGGDSFYELILKQHLLRPLSTQHLRHAFVNVTRAVLHKTARDLDLAAIPTSSTTSSTTTSKRGQARFLGGGSVSSKEAGKTMEHLSCFVPGMLALYYHAMRGQREEEAYGWALEEAEGIMKTCMLMYSSTPTGLAAEAYHVTTGHTPPPPSLPERDAALAHATPHRRRSPHLSHQAIPHSKASSCSVSRPLTRQAPSTPSRLASLLGCGG